MTLTVQIRGQASTDELQWLVARAHLHREQTPRMYRTATPAILGVSLEGRPALIQYTPGGAMTVSAGRVGQPVADYLDTMSRL